MKKTTKILSVMALCVVMLIMSVVPAFADTVYVENHDVIDCSNRYVDNDGAYIFTIKVPKGDDLLGVSLDILYSSTGSILSKGLKLAYESNGVYRLSENVTWLYSDSTSDYYSYKYTTRLGLPTWSAAGIKLYYDKGTQHYMATDTSNGSTVEGPGYFLRRNV